MSLCIFAGDDILRLFYGRGNFGEHEVKMTETVVIGYAAGFIFASARANVVKVFYAFQDTKTPLINGAISILLNIGCSITFSRFLGVGGIALATSVAMLVSVVLLMFKLKKYLPNYH
jgi:putative peptidoglycan lipid II flippase